MQKTLKELREEKGYTQEHMSNELNTSIVAYHLYETGQRKIPEDKAKRIAQILGISLEDFFVPASFSIR